MIKSKKFEKNSTNTNQKTRIKSVDKLILSLKLKPITLMSTFLTKFNKADENLVLKNSENVN